MNPYNHKLEKLIKRVFNSHDPFVIDEAVEAIKLLTFQKLMQETKPCYSSEPTGMTRTKRYAVPIDRVREMFGAL